MFSIMALKIGSEGDIFWAIFENIISPDHVLYY